MRNLRSKANTTSLPPNKKAKVPRKDPEPTTTQHTPSQTDSEHTDSEDTDDPYDDSDKNEDDSEAGNWEDIIENPAGPSKKRRRPARDEEQAALLAKLAELDVDNYSESDMDMSTIDKLLSLRKRKTNNRIRPRIQRELKNLQYMYRRSKKLLALIGHCSEKTVNEFLYVPSVK